MPLIWNQAGPDPIYNYNMAQAQPGPLPLGTYDTDPNGETSRLPGWTVWGQGLAAVVADATWPGGAYVKMLFTGVGSVSVNQVGLTTDLFPVVAGSQVTRETVRAYNIPAGVTLNFQTNILFYSAAGTYISAGTQNDTGAGPLSQSIGTSIGTSTLVPTNARYARYELIIWETVAHDAATYYELGSAALLMQWSFGNYLNDLSVGGKVGLNGNVAVGKQNVTGLKGGNAALASLLAALVTIGLITDGTGV